jgi:hypothetical protein
MPVWNAIEPRQLGRAAEYWLISQPDHAAIAGKLAAGIAADWMPRLTPDVIDAIAVHDDGWREFDASPKNAPSGRPASFLEIEPRDFLRAWAASIEHAARLSALGGVMVSRHFCRLLRGRAESAAEREQDREMMHDFLKREAARQQQLSPAVNENGIETFVDALQFCDVLSLYLCCGATDEVEFPQAFGGRTMRMRCIRTNEFALNPSPFPSVVKFSVPARRWPGRDSVLFPAAIQ